MNTIQFISLVIAFVINSRLAVWLHERRVRRSEKKFLKKVAIHYPHAMITYIALEASDAEAMKKIQAQLK
jgi:hypothetical protein